MEQEPQKGTQQYREWKYQKDLAELLKKIRENYEQNTKQWMVDHDLIRE